MKYLEELTEYFNSLQEKTSIGEIEWVRVNPTTYTWTKSSSPKTDGNKQNVFGAIFDKRVTFQGVHRDNQNIFIFQIFKGLSTVPLVTIDTSENKYAELDASLYRLYIAIQDFFDKRTLSYIKDLLD